MVTFNFNLMVQKREERKEKKEKQNVQATFQMTTKSTKTVIYSGWWNVILGLSSFLGHLGIQTSQLLWNVTYHEDFILIPHVTWAMKMFSFMSYFLMCCSKSKSYWEKMKTPSYLVKNLVSKAFHKAKSKSRY